MYSIIAQEITRGTCNEAISFMRNKTNSRLNSSRSNLLSQIVLNKFNFTKEKSLQTSLIDYNIKQNFKKEFDYTHIYYNYNIIYMINIYDIL